MRKTWHEVLGNYLGAAETLSVLGNSVDDDVDTIAQNIRRAVSELYGVAEDADYAAIAAQLVRDARG